MTFPAVQEFVNWIESTFDAKVETRDKEVTNRRDAKYIKTYIDNIIFNQQNSNYIKVAASIDKILNRAECMIFFFPGARKAKSITEYFSTEKLSDSSPPKSGGVIDLSSLPAVDLVQSKVFKLFNVLVYDCYESQNYDELTADHYLTIARELFNGIINNLDNKLFLLADFVLEITNFLESSNSSPISSATEIKFFHRLYGMPTFRFLEVNNELVYRLPMYFEAGLLTVNSFPWEKFIKNTELTINRVLPWSISKYTHLFDDPADDVAKMQQILDLIVDIEDEPGVLNDLYQKLSIIAGLEGKLKDQSTLVYNQKKFNIAESIIDDSIFNCLMREEILDVQDSEDGSSYEHDTCISLIKKLIKLI